MLFYRSGTSFPIGRLPGRWIMSAQEMASHHRKAATLGVGVSR
jgi:hypothetical protein